MSEQERNKSLMRTVARGFANGDLGPLKAALHDDVVWRSRTPSSHFRFAGEHHRRDGVTEHHALVLSAYDFLRFEPLEIVAEGETVWGLFETELLHRTSGSRAKLEMAIRWIVREGKIFLHENFFDTASLLIQQGDLPPPNAANAT